MKAFETLLRIGDIIVSPWYKVADDMAPLFLGEDCLELAMVEILISMEGSVIMAIEQDIVNAVQNLAERGEDKQIFLALLDVSRLV